LNTFARYFHTVRYLRPVQIAGRIRLRLYRPRPDPRMPPSVRRPSGGVWVKPAERKPSLIASRRFCFLNSAHDLTDCGWDDPALGKLWRYNLHYFDDLNAEGANEREQWHRALLSEWVQKNPPGIGTGWEPYPTSLRIVNWSKWALSGHALSSECVHSLAVQARWLARRLEIHLLGNHLFSNAKALIFAGLFFTGPEANAWLEKGLRVLQQQLAEQILDDGGQFERSPLYQALALEDMLDLCNVTAVFTEAVPDRWKSTIAGWRTRISTMLTWMAAMSHPDGEISYFNDAAVAIAPSPVELQDYATRLGCCRQPASMSGLTHLVESGYIRIEQGDAILLLDVAPLGPDYLLGHAHADTLSFELSLFGQRVFVNSGTSCYGISAERLRQRGTAAHNTVLVDGANSSEVWSGFRVARRARPIELEVTHGDGFAVTCAHDGYKILPGKVTHRRRWLYREAELTVEDQLSGIFAQAEARFHLHPAVTISEKTTDQEGQTQLKFRLFKGQELSFSVVGGTVRTEASTWHPQFGRSEPNLCLVVDFGRATIRTQLKWNGIV
jgi:uncharacterized heparinase superfamily protein